MFWRPRGWVLRGSPQRAGAAALWRSRGTGGWLAGGRFSAAAAADRPLLLHTALAAAAAAAVAAPGESDPAPSIATFREDPEVFAATASHIQCACVSGAREAQRARLPPTASPPA